MPKQPNDYTRILENVVKHIEQSKERAFSEVNKALLQAYWNIGKELSRHSGYGKAVVERLSRDLRMRFSGIRGYSAVNLWYMKRFYETYPQLQAMTVELSKKLQIPSTELPVSQKLQQAFGELTPILQPLAEELPSSQKLQTASEELPRLQKLQMASAELLFSVSWSNHISIMELTTSPEEREFYLRMCVNYPNPKGWGFLRQ